MSFTRIEHGGGAVETTLQSSITNADTSLVLVASTGWPTGSTGPFYLVIDPDTTSEEKIKATSRTSATLNSLTRGVDGTSAVAHSAGATIRHDFTALEADEANQAVVATLGTVTTKGDLLAATGAGALARVAAGANALPLVADSAQSTGLKYATGGLTVPGGGTGATTLTNHGLLVGAGASAVSGITAGTDGQLPIGQTGANPAFTTVSGDVTITAGGVTAIGTAKVTPTMIAAPWCIKSAAVTGGPTSGTTELTLTTLNLAAQTYAYTLDVAAFWTVSGSDTGDVFKFRVYVDGVLKGVAHYQAPSVNEDKTLSIPCITPVAISAATTCAVTVKVQRTSGTGTLTEEAAGVVTARAYFGTSTL